MRTAQTYAVSGVESFEGQNSVMATVVFVHAHPDDEAILTAGTMHALVQAGHRVVLALATDGAAGLTDDFHSGELGNRRLAESQAAADAIGIARREWLGFADSGLDAQAASSRKTLCAASVDECAERLAQLLKEEDADVVVGYDARGGYGHPDHLRIHEMTHRAAALHATPYVFEATLNRNKIRRAILWAAPLGTFLKIDAVNNLINGFSDESEIAIEVDVRLHRAIKKASMRAHASQTVGGALPRSLQLFLSLPDSLFDHALGREYFNQTAGDADSVFSQLPSATSRRHD